jgi:hypothetical protein
VAQRCSITWLLYADGGAYYSAARDGNYQEKTPQEIRAFLLQGDPKSGLDVDLVWDVMHFVGTPKLHDLLRILELNNWEAMHSELSPPLGQVLVEMEVVALGFRGK